MKKLVKSLLLRKGKHIVTLLPCELETVMTISLRNKERIFVSEWNVSYSIDEIRLATKDESKTGIRNKALAEKLEAAQMAKVWNTLRIKDFYSDTWCDILDGLDELKNLLINIGRLFLSPVLVIYLYFLDRKRQAKIILNMGEEEKQKARNKVEIVQKRGYIS